MANRAAYQNTALQHKGRIARGVHGSAARPHKSGNIDGGRRVVCIDLPAKAENDYCKASTPVCILTTAAARMGRVRCPRTSGREGTWVESECSGSTRCLPTGLCIG